MMSIPSQKPFLYMAPLRGITDALFRRIYCNHFHGIDSAIAPFINPQRKAVFSDKLLSDILPDPNCSLPVIPQILNSDPDGFIVLADRLYELGYKTVNWNLGCPVPMVAKKRRGSGLLPYPDQIVELIEQVLPRLRCQLSIKMRLGFQNYQESLDLLPRLDKFPLAEIIIHARLGKQLYKGPTAPERFAECADQTRHSLVYNGDITSFEIYADLADRLPAISSWMIGRGLLANPFLPAEIKASEFSGLRRRERLAAFHDELFLEMKRRLSGPGHLLGRMKQVWIYFIESFPEKKKLLKNITKASSEQKYLEAVRTVIFG